MRLSFFALSGLCVLAACAGTPQDRSVTTNVTSHNVQQGVFTDRTCDGLRDDRIDSCTCEGDITAARSDDPAIDARLLHAAERRICKGVPVDAPDGVLINQRKLDYEVTLDNEKWLSVVYSFYEMNAGAAHGLTTQEAMLYDKVNVRWVPQAELVFPAHREGASQAVLNALEKADASYEGALWPENIERVFTEKGCEGCILYPTPNGWKVNFMPYGAGPYSVGLVTVPLDGGFIWK